MARAFAHPDAPDLKRDLKSDAAIGSSVIHQQRIAPISGIQLSSPHLARQSIGLVETGPLRTFERRAPSALQDGSGRRDRRPGSGGRGLKVQGLGTGLNGVRFLSGQALHVEDCTITNFSNLGLDFEPSAAAQLFVKSTVISQNTVGNIYVSQGRAVIAKSQLLNAGYGLNVTGTAQASVHDTTFSGHSGIAIHASSSAEINVDHGLIANNGVGVQGDSMVRLSEVMVSNNTTGVSGTVASFGNNRVAAGNATNGTPSSTIPQQ